MSESLPHIIPGQPRRSMYGEHNTHDEQVALTAAAFQALVNMQAERQENWRIYAEAERVMREPIRVVAEVGRRIEA